MEPDADVIPIVAQLIMVQVNPPSIDRAPQFPPAPLIIHMLSGGEYATSRPDTENNNPRGVNVRPPFKLYPAEFDPDPTTTKSASWVGPADCTKVRSVVYRAAQPKPATVKVLDELI